MSPTFAEGTVRVTTPPSYDAHEAAPTGGCPTRRSSRTPSATTCWSQPSGTAELDLVQTVDLTPRAQP